MHPTLKIHTDSLKNDVIQQLSAYPVCAPKKKEAMRFKESAKLVVLLALALVISASLFAQAAYSFEKWGYINDAGAYVIQPQYMQSYSFNNGLAEVKRLKAGNCPVCKNFSTDTIYIDKSNRVSAAPAQAVRSNERKLQFSDGLAPVCETDKRPWHFVDESGKTVFKIPENAVCVGLYSEGLASVAVPAAIGQSSSAEDSRFRWGFMDRKGNWAIKPQFMWEERSGCVFSYTDGPMFKNGRAKFAKETDDGRRYGFIDKTGNFVIAPKFNNAYEFQDGLAAASQNVILKGEEFSALMKCPQHWTKEKWNYNYSKDTALPVCSKCHTKTINAFLESHGSYYKQFYVCSCHETRYEGKLDGPDRHDLWRHFVEQYKVIGMTRDELAALLGKTAADDSYDAGAFKVILKFDKNKLSNWKYEKKTLAGGFRGVTASILAIPSKLPGGVLKFDYDALSIEVKNPAWTNDETPDFGPYQTELRRRIKRAWFPPKGQENRRLTVSFRVSTNGNMSELQIAKTSGIANVDQAGLDAVKNAAPFRPLPAGAPECIKVIFTFDYDLYQGIKK